MTRDQHLTGLAGVERAIQAAGGPARLAERLNVSRQLIHYWREHGVTPERAVQIEAAIGAAVLRSDMRPDLYDNWAPSR